MFKKGDSNQIYNKTLAQILVEYTSAVCTFLENMMFIMDNDWVTTAILSENAM
jgi:hypothetical protein